jgi:hypothetical protein
MSQEIGTSEYETAGAPDPPAQADGGQNTAIGRLFEKLRKAQPELEEGSEELPASEENQLPGQTEPSVINRLFEKVNTCHGLEALAAPAADAKQPVSRITQTQIKAMRAVTTTSESKPEVVVRKQFLGSLNTIWCDITYYFHSLFPAKKK